MSILPTSLSPSQKRRALQHLLSATTFPTHKINPLPLITSLTEIHDAANIITPDQCLQEIIHPHKNHTGTQQLQIVALKCIAKRKGREMEYFEIAKWCIDTLRNSQNVELELEEVRR